MAGNNNVQLLTFLSHYQGDSMVFDIGSGKKVTYDSLFKNRVRVDNDESSHPDVVGDITNLPITDNFCKDVICINVLEHVFDIQKATQELTRILRPGGRLIIATSMIKPLSNIPSDHWRITPYTLKKLFSELDLKRVSFESGPFSSIANTLQHITSRTDIRLGFIIRPIISVLSFIFRKMDFFITKEYDSARKEISSFGLFSTGTYMVFTKKEVV